MAIKKINIADKTTLDENYSATNEILTIVKNNQSDIKRYGVKIAKNNSDPNTRVEYTYDAVGFTPAKMNYTTGAFDYGSWGDIWFIKKNYPVMLNSNGEVAYKLNPNDYTKKENGDASDIANDDFDGNAMSKIPLVWVSFSEDANYEYITVAEDKYDESYHAIAHTKEDGTILNDIYLSIYHGSLIGEKLRSLSGKYGLMEITAEQEVGYATANGTGWYTRTWSQRQLINTLLTIIGKSDDTQTTFGTGATNTFTNLNDRDNYFGMLPSGGANDKGQFFGTNDGINHVKVFHMEDWWGNQYERIAGLINDNGTIKVSMTGPYNTTGEGYDVVSCPAPKGTSGGYITGVTTGKYGRIPYSTENGSASTYLCDSLWFDNARVTYGRVGCGCGTGVNGGAYSCNLQRNPVFKDWSNTACVSFM